MSFAYPAGQGRARALSYLDSGISITEAQQVTNSQGEALLEISLDAAQRGDLRIEITGASGPALHGPAETAHGGRRKLSNLSLIRPL